MSDPRVAKLADLLVNYSVELQPGQLVRIDADEAKWVGTRFPTDAHAQDAEMSLPEYEDFVYTACHVREHEDPVAHWRSTSAALSARARELETFRELRIVGPDTDLRVNV